jgi:hypothetical protein
VQQRGRNDELAGRMHRSGARRGNNVTRVSTRKPPFRDAKSAH